MTEKSSQQGSLNGESTDVALKFGARKLACIDLGAEALPKLEKGIWGTEWLVTKLNLLPGYRLNDAETANDEEVKRLQIEAENEPAKQSGLRGSLGAAGLAAFTIASVALYVVLLYLDWNAKTSLGPPLILGCNYRFMPSATTSCGLNAASCRPFETDDWAPARCGRFCRSEEVIGSDIYRADQHICASAIHAGVISNARGGCFAYRFAGEQNAFNGSDRNGLNSKSSGWFPKSMEFKEIESSRCNTVRPWIDFYSFGCFVILVLFIRPANSVWVFLYLISEGSLYLSTWWLSGDPMIYEFNFQFSVYSFVVLPSGYLLYLWFVKGTMPDPRQFPLDIIVFYYLPFWGGIRMDHLTEIGFDVTLTADIFSSPAYIVGVIMLAVVAVPLLFAQGILHIRAGNSRKALFLLMMLFVPVLLFSTLSKDYLSFHLHHYFLGMMGVAFFQGQPWCRFSIIAQGALLGSFVNGIMVWNADPFFDNVSPESSPTKTSLQLNFWSGIQLANDSITLEWVTAETVFDWGCNHTTLNPFVKERVTSTSSSSSRILSTKPFHIRRSLTKLPLPPPRLSSSRLIANGILLFDGHLDPDQNATYSITRENLYPNVNYTFSASLDGVGTLPLRVVANSTFTSETFYDPSNATFAEDPCERIIAIHTKLLSSP